MKQSIHKSYSIFILFFAFLFFIINNVSATDTISYAVNSSDIMRSYDGGLTWTSVYTDAAYDFDKIITSTDGRFVFAISNKGFNASSTSPIIYSNDYGATFYSSPSSYALMTDIAIADGGTTGYIFITNCTHLMKGFFDLTTPYAVNFNSPVSIGYSPYSCSLSDNRGLAVSSDGQYVYASENQQIRKSNLGGLANWTTATSILIGSIRDLCASDNGQYLYATRQTDNPLLSSNYGTSFIDVYPSAGTSYLFSQNKFVCSNQKSLIVSDNNDVSYSTNYMANGTSTKYNDTSVTQLSATSNLSQIYNVYNSSLYLSLNNGQSWSYRSGFTGLSWFTSSDGLVDEISSSEAFQVSLDSTNANLVGTQWYSYPFGVPLQSYPIVVTTASGSNGYVGIQCNYTEYNLLDDKFEYDNTSLNGWIGCDYYTGSYNIAYKKSMFIDYTRCNATDKKAIFPIGQQTEGGLILFNYYPTTNGSLTVEFLNTLGVVSVVKNVISYDGSQICVYKNTETLPNKLYCFTYNPFVNGDLLFRISIAYDVDFTYTIDSKMSTSSSFINGDAITFSNDVIGYVAFQTSNVKGYVDNLNISQIRGFSPFETIVDNVTVTTAQASGFPNLINVNFTDYEACAFGQTYGDVKIRVYYHATNSQTWNNYKDLNVQLRTLDQKVTDGGATFDEQTQNFVDELFGSNLSSAQKLFYTLMVMFVTIVITVVACFSVGMSGTVVSVLSGGIAFVELIFFAFIGFIPVWIIIVLAIISAGIVAMAFKSMVTR